MVFCSIHVYDLGSLPLPVKGHLENTKLILVTVTWDKCCCPQEAQGVFTGERMKTHQDLPNEVTVVLSFMVAEDAQNGEQTYGPWVGLGWFSSQPLHIMTVQPWEKCFPSWLPLSPLCNRNIGSIYLTGLSGVLIHLKWVELSRK